MSLAFSKRRGRISGLKKRPDTFCQKGPSALNAEEEILIKRWIF
jgi:hypothetical protein